MWVCACVHIQAAGSPRGSQRPGCLGHIFLHVNPRPVLHPAAERARSRRGHCPLESSCTHVLVFRQPARELLSRGTPGARLPTAGCSQHSGVAAGEPGRFLGLSVPHGHLIEAAWAAPAQQPEFASWASSRREEKAEREQLPCGRPHPSFYGWPCQARARKAGAIGPKGPATAPRALGAPESWRETRPSGSAVPLREPSGQPPPLGCRLIPARACGWQDLIAPSGAGSAGRAQKCPPPAPPLRKLF